MKSSPLTGLLSRFLSFSLAGGIVACERQPAQRAATTESAAVTVRTVPVSRRAVERTVEITGTLFGQEEITVSAKVPGRVESIRADLGDVVEPGSPLAQIERADYELAVSERRAALDAALAKIGLAELPAGEPDLSTLPLVARATAQEANAQARMDRARQLFEREPPLLSAQDFADIRTQWEVAATSAQVELLDARAALADARVRAAELAVAEKALADTVVIAPGGLPLELRVASRRVSIGEQLTAGQPLFRLVATDRVKFRGMVPERYSAEVRQGARARIRVDSAPTAFEATVSRVSPAVDAATRALEIEVEAANPDGVLKPGAFARVVILIGEQPGAIFVPVSAVTQFAGVQRVFSVAGGKAVEHRVELGERVGDLVELLDAGGLTDRVVDQPGRLVAGAAVREQ